MFAACNAPVSTVRSPYHLRVVEVRNTTESRQTLLIAPTESQHLGAATTFTGELRPGEVKVLYLYHGFEYKFEIVEGPSDAAATTVKVDRDMGLAFAGDSIIQDVVLTARLGEPTTTFADSMMSVDPFGIRADDALGPDSARGRNRALIDPAERRAREERERSENAQQGKSP